jgi:hypothetical protein
MANIPQSLDALLRQCLEEVKTSGSQLQYESTAAAATEETSVILGVKFAPTAADSTLSLSRLMELLAKHTVVASVDLLGSEGHVVLFGMAEGINYKIVVQLRT